MHKPQLAKGGECFCSGGALPLATVPDMFLK